MTPGLVPMIAPDGSTGDIPAERTQDAMKAGFKPAVVMTAPDGSMGYIPRDRAADALKAGFKVGQPGIDNSIQNPPHYAIDEMTGVLPGIVRAGRNIYKLPGQITGAFFKPPGSESAGGANDPALLASNPLEAGLQRLVVGPYLSVTEKGGQKLDEARQLLKQGQTGAAISAGSEAAGYTLAGALPGAGPWAANLGERAGRGDVSGALTELAGTYAGTAGVGEAAKLGVAKVAPQIADTLRENATKQYGQALNPTKESTKYLTAKRTPEMIERGITASSPKELAANAGAQASELTTRLEDIYESLPVDRTSPTAPMIQALEQYKTKFQDRLPLTEEQFRAEVAANKGEPPTNIVQNTDGSLSKVIDLNPNAINAANAMQDTIRQYGDSISPASMRKARQVFDDAVARANGYAGKSLPEGSLLDAQREAASAIREQLAKDNPEIAPLNKEINFWLDVQRIAQETTRRRVGQQGGLLRPMAKRTGQVIGGVVGAQMGGVWGAGTGAVLGGEVMGKLAQVTQSTRWRTVSGVMKTRLANALASGDEVSVGARLNEITRAMQSASLATPVNTPQSVSPAAKLKMAMDVYKRNGGRISPTQAAAQVEANLSQDSQ